MHYTQARRAAVEQHLSAMVSPAPASASASASASARNIIPLSVIFSLVLVAALIAASPSPVAHAAVARSATAADEMTTPHLTTQPRHSVQLTHEERSSAASTVIFGTPLGSITSSASGLVSLMSNRGDNFLELLSHRATRTAGNDMTPTAVRYIGFTPLAPQLALITDLSHPAARGVTWQCAASYLGLALGTIGFVIATGGTAIVFSITGASYIVNVAGILSTCK